MSKIMITCALTGSIHTPSMSPYLPITADDIISQGVDAANAGAAVLHLHARDPQNGRPSASVDHYMGFLPNLYEQTDAVLNITTGGSAVMTLQDRLAAALHVAPEMCSLNMGSMNFALYPMAVKDRDWRFDWEKPFLENSDDLVFKNTPRDIEFILTEMGQNRGAGFEFECYDLSHVYMLHHFKSRGLIRGKVFLQFVFGVLGGMGPDPENLIHIKRLADKLLGDDYEFSVLAAGRHQIPMAAMAASMGGHVRVGLEDNLFIDRGVLAKSNAEQVEKIARIVQDMGRTPATPQDARDILGLKGAAATNLGAV